MDGEQYRCCFALCTSVEHQCVRYARQLATKNKNVVALINFPKSTRGTAGYRVLHSPILLEEQESRSGTSTYA